MGDNGDYFRIGEIGMRRLLNQTELRQLRLIETLYKYPEWITYAELAEKLDCSVRVLKDDVTHFIHLFDEFTIERSNQGIRLVINKDTGLKFFYKHTFERSVHFRILETLFIEQGILIKDLVDRLFISTSTIYRLIEQINHVLADFDFQIGLNPTRIVGNEQNIRTFFYNYFAEKYTYLDWPFPEIHEGGMRRLLQFLIDYTGLKVDFAYNNFLINIATINFIRYKYGHLISEQEKSFAFDSRNEFLKAYEDAFNYFEAVNHVKVDVVLIQQVFSPYLDEGYSLDYEHLVEKMEKSDSLKRELSFLNHMLEKVSVEQGIELYNEETIVLMLQNFQHLEKFEPRSGHVLYDRCEQVIEIMEREFPIFYSALYEGVEEYSHILEEELPAKMIDYMVYFIFTTWDGLLANLRRKYTKIKILVISDQGTAHAKMLKDFIDYEFHEQIQASIYEHQTLDKDILEQIEANIIVASFALPQIQGIRSIYIESIPTFIDISRIRNVVDEIIIERIHLNQF